MIVVTLCTSTVATVLSAYDSEINILNLASIFLALTILVYSVTMILWLVILLFRL